MRGACKRCQARLFTQGISPARGLFNPVAWLCSPREPLHFLPRPNSQAAASIPPEASWEAPAERCIYFNSLSSLSLESRVIFMGCSFLLLRVPGHCASASREDWGTQELARGSSSDAPCGQRWAGRIAGRVHSTLLGLGPGWFLPAS